MVIVQGSMNSLLMQLVDTPLFGSMISIVSADFFAFSFSLTLFAPVHFFAARPSFFYDRERVERKALRLRGCASARASRMRDDR